MTTLIVVQATLTTTWITTSFAVTLTTALVASSPLHLRKGKLGDLGLDCFCSLQLLWRSLWFYSSKRNKRSGTKSFPCHQSLRLQSRMHRQRLMWKKASQSHLRNRSGNQPQNEKFPRNRQFTCRKSNCSRFKLTLTQSISFQLPQHVCHEMY